MTKLIKFCESVLCDMGEYCFNVAGLLTLKGAF